MNLEQDIKYSVMKVLETRVAPYFTVFTGDSSYVKYTDYRHLYSCGFSDWNDRIVSTHCQIVLVISLDSRLACWLPSVGP